MPSARVNPREGLVIRDARRKRAGERIGAARESVSRAMKQLRRQGLVQSAGRKQLLIPSLAGLRAMLPGADPQRHIEG